MSRETNPIFSKICELIKYIISLVQKILGIAVEKGKDVKAPPPNSGKRSKIRWIKIRIRRKPKKRKKVILSPYIEIDLDKTSVFIVIPKQEFQTDEILESFDYEIELNNEKQKINSKVEKKIKKNEEIHRSEKVIIELKQPLKSLRVVYPEELENREYTYRHINEFLYVFTAIGNNRGKMYYLYDNNEEIKPLPKKQMWILLRENFEVDGADIDIIEENWFWEHYRPYRINLKNTNEIIIKNKLNKKEEIKIRCQPSFSIEGNLIEDDLKEEIPLFTGDSVKIKTSENQPNYKVYIQNGQNDSEIISKDWNENQELELKSADLPGEGGEFEVDIYANGKDITPIETLAFRYIPQLQIDFPKKIIIPDPTTGHRSETIKIALGAENWKIRQVDGGIYKQKIDNTYYIEIELPPQQDTCYLYLNKEHKGKKKFESEVDIIVTIPRLRWKIHESGEWIDKTLEIKRDKLIPGTNLYLIVRTNDHNKYNISAVLEANDQALQKETFVKKGKEYGILLNRFYDTIKNTKDKMKLAIEILNPETNELIGRVDVINLPEIIPEEPVSQIPEHKIKPKIKPKIRPKIRPYVKGRRGFRVGKGFSEREIKSSNLSINMISKLNICFDRRRKTEHLINIEMLNMLKTKLNNGNGST
ncbi:MAG: hypothetical protein ABDI07_04865 [Candidatus Kryptonium sp.]